MNKLYLAFVWHQHQPFYKDLNTGKSILPWVRLHAAKDYYDMAALLDEFPKIQMTINLVPSLIMQLQDFAENKTTDPWLEKTIIEPEKLTEEDRVWILENFFFCNWDTMIFPNARYAELFEKRGKFSSSAEIARIQKYFTQQEFLDLQVWFNLAWMDPLWRENDPLIKHLYDKGKNFTLAEKWLLIGKQKEICKLVIEKHKTLWHQGQIEISTTPFYHPILPLLCDTDSAQMSMPGSLKPSQKFQHPEDAQIQVEKAVKYMESVFGKRPVGMWPSEGSVSETVIPILTKAGIQWTATDEGILFNSLKLMNEQNVKREWLYQTYWAAPENTDARLQMVFRDHSLSDAIGFNYSRMPAQKAVEDFIGHLTKIADAVEPDGPHLVSVILDGENCWEYYSKDGIDFLRALYSALENHPRIETTTISNYLQKFPAQKTIKKLWAGSWINSDFSIWIGHPEDNKAWEYVAETRDFLMETLKKNPEKINDPKTALAWESLYIAEGSDWCWWYGDQNSTAHDEIFDQLFRSHLKNVYHFLEKNPPEKLNLAIKRRIEKEIYFHHPMRLMTPQIDGLVSSYYEWHFAGCCRSEPVGGAMHTAQNLVSSLYFGFDLDNLYFRIDAKTALSSLKLEEIQMKISFLAPAGNEIKISWDSSGNIYGIFMTTDGLEKSLTQICSGKIIECTMPFSFLNIKPNDPVEFMLVVQKDGITLENVPHGSTIKTQRPAEDFGSDLWSAI